MGLRARLLLAFLVPTFALLSCGGFVLYRAVRVVLEDSLGESLTRLAAAASSTVKAERVLAVTADDAHESSSSRTYRALVSQLHELQKTAGVQRIFIVDAERRMRVDGAGLVPPLAEATELLRDSRELQRVFIGERVASEVLFEGVDHRLYKTGYAPLVSDSGAVVGAVAVEGTAAFFGPLVLLRNAFLVLGLLTLGLLFLAAVWSARALSAPLERLVRSALRIGRGDLKTSVPTEKTREIGILSVELEAMRRALQQRDRQLTMMLAGVAHEVKNPLGGIELFTGLLDEELVDSPSRSHVKRIRSELDYLKRIVDDFLVFARDEKVQPAAFEARAFIDHAVAHVRGDAQALKVELQVTAAEATLDGDESLLTSALLNVVKNAVQVAKTVTVVGRVEAAAYVIEVTDDGPGIADDVQAQIFEPFFTTKEKGTGLGLPLAKKILDAHRGTLRVTSRAGHTVFSLQLPLRPAPT